MPLFSPQYVVSAVVCICLTHTNTHSLAHTSFHRTFVLSAPVWCNSCMDSLCASPRSSSCLFRKLICCWVLSLLLSWRTHETNNDDGGQNSNYATNQTCPEVQGNASTMSTADLAFNDLEGSNGRFISCSKWADILVHTHITLRSSFPWNKCYCRTESDCAKRNVTLTTAVLWNYVEKSVPPTQSGYLNKDP